LVNSSSVLSSAARLMSVMVTGAGALLALANEKVVDLDADGGKARERDGEGRSSRPLPTSIVGFPRTAPTARKSGEVIDGGGEAQALGVGMGCAQSERRREENVGTMVEMTKAVAREKREKM
jgi:hypothetical protein